MCQIKRERERGGGSQKGRMGLVKEKDRKLVVRSSVCYSCALVSGPSKAAKGVFFPNECSSSRPFVSERWSGPKGRPAE